MEVIETFNKEETKNIISMLQSPDKDNHHIAFQSLSALDFENYKGELIVLYKNAGHNLKYWQEHCLKAYEVLINLIPIEVLTSPKALSLIIANKGSDASIELFMEYFVLDMTKMLDAIGYPPDCFEVNIKLKK
jgi:hypothetical protein